MYYSNEKILVRELKRGNEAAYKFLFDNYYSLLCKIANGYVRDKIWAESIVDDTFFHLWEIREKLNIKSSLLSYLIRAVHNRCVNHLERIRFSKNSSAELLPLDEMTLEHIFSMEGDYIHDALSIEELSQLIKKAIDELPDGSKKVFCESRFNNKKYSDISRELGISVNTVKYHIKYALDYIRKRLSSYFSNALLISIIFALGIILS